MLWGFAASLMIVESLRERERERGRELELQMDDAISLEIEIERTITHIEEQLICAMVDQHRDALMIAVQ